MRMTLVSAMLHAAIVPGRYTVLGADVAGNRPFRAMSARSTPVTVARCPRST
jgi:hypothetical protein